mmetsp:Transcript_51847/g.126470  ORF Transcript_51847/g.126470 Transcript_51847/m.126470 type:complete len:81 (+) Transcript_51847:616-858(+)
MTKQQSCDKGCAAAATFFGTRSDARARPLMRTGSCTSSLTQLSGSLDGDAVLYSVLFHMLLHSFCPDPLGRHFWLEHAFF